MTKPSRDWKPSMRRLGEAHLDDCVVCNFRRPRGRECGELPQLLRREGNDLRVLTTDHHGGKRNGKRPGADVQKTAEIHHNHNPAVTVANQSANATENV